MFQTISKLNKRKRLTLDLGLILAISILVTVPIFFIGIPGGADMWQHFQFAKNFDDSISEGSFYPSWAADPNLGKGSVGNRIYPPLAHYTFLLFTRITGNWFDGFCVSIILLFFLGGVGIYFWAREFFDESGSLFGAITYILLPYHINQIYGATMYSEFTAGAVAPFCFLFAYKVCRKASLTSICGLGISFSLLILSHIPLTVFCSISLVIFSLFSLRGVKFFPAICRLATGVLIGLLLSCFYWIRMVTEINYVNHNSEQYYTGYFSYTNHFQFAKYFPFTGVPFDTSVDFGDLTLFVSSAILVSGALIYYFKTKENKNFQLLNVLIVTAFAFFMSTPLSMVVWKYVPILQKTQFPWRWMTIFEIGTAIFAAAAFKPVIEYFRTSRRYLSLLFIGFWIVAISFNTMDIMTPILTYPRDYFVPIVERWKSVRSNPCWWTVWSKPSQVKRELIDSAGLGARVLIGNRNVEIEKWESTERVFQINEGESGTFFVETFYYPHWKATVNGQAVEVSPNENGLISLPVPAEKSEVKVYFQEPQFVIAAFYTSGFAWIIILSLLIFGLLRKNSANIEE